MAKNPLDLPAESLASLDETGHRLFIYPAAVRGFFHQRRQWVQAILMLIFLLLPWIKVSGHQAVLLDLPRRQFAIFGLTFWAHDGPILFFVLATAGFSLFFVTAIWGRVWCGWACPQTVFIESVFRRIEILFEGNHIERRRLNEGPWSKAKVSKKLGKWFAYLAASLIITHSFLAYFVGTDQLMQMVIRPPSENWTSFLVILFTTAIVLVDFGWFREQFCIIACPYGRFQSVLQDEQSLGVGYDQRRGEPRRSPDVPKEKQGACVNCFKCVAVCPTAIDIRRGSQMECIACTACIDACDEVMTKLNQPTGLIRYATEAELKGQAVQVLRPRVFIYGALLLIAVIGLIVAVNRREDAHVSIQRAVEIPYRQIVAADGQPHIVNHFKIHVKNHLFVEQTFELSLPPAHPEIKLLFPQNKFIVQPGKDYRIQFFIEFPPGLTKGQGRFELDAKMLIRSSHIEQVIPQRLNLIGPP